MKLRPHDQVQVDCTEAAYERNFGRGATSAGPWRFDGFVLSEALKGTLSVKDPVGDEIDFTPVSSADGVESNGPIPAAFADLLIEELPEHSAAESIAFQSELERAEQGFVDLLPAKCPPKALLAKRDTQRPFLQQLLALGRDSFALGHERTIQILRLRFPLADLTGLEVKRFIPPRLHANRVESEHRASLTRKEKAEKDALAQKKEQEEALRKACEVDPRRDGVAIIRCDSRRLPPDLIDLIPSFDRDGYSYFVLHDLLSVPAYEDALSGLSILDRNVKFQLAPSELRGKLLPTAFLPLFMAIRIAKGLFDARAMRPEELVDLSTPDGRYQRDQFAAFLRSSPNGESRTWAEVLYDGNPKLRQLFVELGGRGRNLDPDTVHDVIRETLAEVHIRRNPEPTLPPGFKVTKGPAVPGTVRYVDTYGNSYEPEPWVRPEYNGWPTLKGDCEAAFRRGLYVSPGEAWQEPPSGFVQDVLDLFRPKVDPWAGVLPAVMDEIATKNKGWVRRDEIMTALARDGHIPGVPTREDNKRVTRILKRSGWKETRADHEGQERRVFVRAS
jgi:hypothetical protein